MKVAWLLLGILSAFLFGANAVVSRWITLEGADPIWIAALRLYTAALVIFLYTRFTADRNLKIKNRILLLVAGISVAANFFLFHYGLAFTTASAAMVLETTAPIFALILLALVFGDKITSREIAAVAIAAIGIVLVVFTPGTPLPTGTIVGNLLEVGAAVTWAVFVVTSKKLIDKQTPLTLLVEIFLIAGAILTPFLLVTAPPTLPQLAVILAQGVITTAFAYTLYYHALKRVSAVTGILLFTLSLFFAILLSSIFLGEKMSFSAVFGVILIIAGIILSKRQDKS